MKTMKFKAFAAMGVVAVGLLSANMYQSVQASNLESEAKNVTTCEQMVEKVNHRIANPMKKGDLNNDIALKVADAQDSLQNQLISTSPQKVECNIKSSRDKFINKVNDINRPKIGYSTTAG